MVLLFPMHLIHKKDKVKVMRLKWLFSLCLMPSLAWAQVVTDNSQTLTAGTPYNCLPSQANYRTFALQNLSSVNMGYCFRSSPSTPCTVSIGSAGTWTLYPSQLISWGNGEVPTSGMDCAIASSTGILDIAFSK